MFGKVGKYFYNIAHGMDDRPVEPNRIRKSIGKETTLIEDIDDTNQIIEILENIADRLENSLFKREAKGRTITLKLKYFDFQSITRSVTIEEPADSASLIMECVRPLLSKIKLTPAKKRSDCWASQFQILMIKEPAPETFVNIASFRCH